MASVRVNKTPARFYPDARRIITKRFEPSGPETPDGRTRAQCVLQRVLELPEKEVVATFAQTLERFSRRHSDFQRVLESSFETMAHLVDDVKAISKERQLLIGAYFVHEYSIEAAALCNPSIVQAPDQTGLDSGEVRIVLSLRAIGEGHLSSIEFRSGVVDHDGNVMVDAPARYATTAKRRSATYEKETFREKLIEMRVYSDIAATVIEPLAAQFSMEDLERAIDTADHKECAAMDVSRETRALHWLASSNYESSFSPETQLSERVLFPAAPVESSGMEDARFVRFVDDDGKITYFATYTAYDGFQILPQLIETTDFIEFKIATLNGACSKNKGIALFPRKIGGKYAALARLDNENNFYMTSHNVRFWHESQVLHRPLRAWELSNVGNCGSPIETEEGWLMITHGVGAMRQYAIGALLLDLDEPSRVIGQLEVPLLEPNEHEREGYVPNVVYSCGSMVVGDRLILPYGFSDSGTGIATVVMKDLLAELGASRRLH